MDADTQLDIFTLTGAITLGFAVGAAFVAKLALPESPPIPGWVSTVRTATLGSVAIVMLSGIGTAYTEWRERRGRALLFSRQRLADARRGLRKNSRNDNLLYLGFSLLGVAALAFAVTYSRSLPEVRNVVKVGFGSFGILYVFLGPYFLASSGEPG